MLQEHEQQEQVPPAPTPPRRRRRGLLAGLAVAVVLTLLGGFLMFRHLSPSSDPGKVAVAYESAYQNRDYGRQWDLAGPEIRGGLPRDQFIAAGQAADAANQLPPLRIFSIVAARTESAGTRATVLLQLTLPGNVSFDTVTLARNGHNWQVISDQPAS